MTQATSNIHNVECFLQIASKSAQARYQGSSYDHTLNLIISETIL